MLRLEVHAQGCGFAYCTAFEIEFNAKAHHLHISFTKTGSSAAIADCGTFYTGGDAHFIRIVHGILFSICFNYPASRVVNFIM
jgi:hypothetical protein